MAEELDDIEKFSDDPNENLKIENDILKLKLQAELGGEFEADNNLPVEVENEFLKNIIAFEHEYANTARKTVYEALNKPSFTPESQLGDKELTSALNDLFNIMNATSIVLEFKDEYSDRLKYKFITEELFLQELFLVQVPGMTMHYSYEDFHPNHKLSIKLNAEEFLDHWLRGRFDQLSSELSSRFILQDGTTLDSEKLSIRLSNFFESYQGFTNPDFVIENISYDIVNTAEGLGFAEGAVSYDAETEAGEVVHFEGPFKLYMEYDGNWSIYFFIWPGFTW